jgi:hypothetical protein
MLAEWQQQKPNDVSQSALLAQAPPPEELALTLDDVLVSRDHATPRRASRDGSALSA